MINPFLLSSTALNELRTGNVIVDMVLASIVTAFFAWLLTYNWIEMLRVYCAKREEDKLMKTRITKSKEQTDRQRDGAIFCYDLVLEYIESRMDDIECNQRKMFVYDKRDASRFIDRYECEHATAAFFPEIRFTLDNLVFSMEKTKKKTPKEKKPTKEETEENDNDAGAIDEKYPDLFIYHDTVEEIQTFMDQVFEFIRKKYKYDDDGLVSFLYKYREGDYIDSQVFRSAVFPCSFDSLCVPSTERKDLQRLCHDFKHKQGHYDPQNNKPYSLTLLFTGPPGNGKTATIQMLISYFDVKRVQVVNTISMFRKDHDLRHLLFNKSTDLELIVFEELDAGDCERILECRKSKEVRKLTIKKDGITAIVKEKDASISSSMSDSRSSFTLSTWLDTFNGLMIMNNKIIIMTTNHLEYLDPAVYRRKRVTSIIHFDNVTHESLEQFMQLFWPEPEEKYDTSFLPPKTINHALLWDVKDLHKPVSRQDFLEKLQYEMQKENKLLQK